MSRKKVIKSNQIVKIISPEEQTYISTTDAEMDFRAVQAVRAAVSKAKICKKPIAKYNEEKKEAYIEYPDGRKITIRQKN